MALPYAVLRRTPAPVRRPHSAKQPYRLRSICAALGLAAAFNLSPAGAHGDSHSTKGPRATPSTAEETAFGRAGDPKKVTRTITIDMSDAMRYSPAALTLRQGETIRFVLRNTGKTLHEFVLGTLPELKAHAELMKKFPGMVHDEPYMTHVAPGKTGTVVWQFTRSGDFLFGCLLPGHFEAGMTGTLHVTQR